MIEGPNVTKWKSMFQIKVPDQLSNLPPVMTNWAISPQQKRINSSKRRQQTEVDWCFVYSTQSFDRLKFFYMSIDKNFEKKNSKFMKFFFLQIFV